MHVKYTPPVTSSAHTVDEHAIAAYLSSGLELAISPYRPLCFVVSYACSTRVWLSSACEKA